jgi:CRP/FNR family transcriptional regulator, anaerobic regulatory protein
MESSIEQYKLKFMDDFKQHIEKIAKLTEEEWTAFSRILTIKNLNRKEYFLKEGQICKSSAFISKGLFRIYSIDALGNEKIIQFNPENSFLSDCESYLSNKASDYNIEAIERSTLIVFNNADLEKLCKMFPVFDKISRQVTYEILSYYKEHLKLVMTKTPKERYDYLLANKAELVQKVSVTHLSQFLGLARETVSRLRKKFTEV